MVVCLFTELENEIEFTLTMKQRCFFTYKALVFYIRIMQGKQMYRVV